MRDVERINTMEEFVGADIVGLFSFIKEVGENLFGNSDEEKAKAIADAIAQKNLDLTNLSVVVKGDKVILAGQAASAKDAEIALLLAGNFKGMAEVDGSGLMIHTPTPAPDTTASLPQVPQMKTVVVRSGDTLSKLAAEHLGSANRYMVLFEANKPMLTDPNKIYPGQTLRIPESGAAHA
jgi:nucleoid-associated protein YgaU